MLMAIHSGRVDSCQYKQRDIVHLELYLGTALNGGLQEFVFFDRNATKAYSTAYTDLDCLETAVDWDILTESPRLDGFCKYFQDRPTDSRYVDRMEKRQAEVLMKGAVSLNWFSRIGVCDEVALSRVRQLLSEHQAHIIVEIVPDWYFLGQR